MPEQPITPTIEFDPEDEYRPEPEPEPLPPSWMDGSLRIGFHTSIAGSYLNAVESARKLGCNALQIFSASPRMWQGGSARIPEVDAQAFRARRDELGLGPLVVHANYLINLAASQPMLRTRSIQAFHDEIVRAVALGADFLVGHRGGRVDRHEHIGKGKIGAEAFARILRHPRFGAAPPEGLMGRAFVAETPIDDPGDDRRNVAALWELAGLKEQAPEAEKGFSMLTPALKKKISENRKTEKKRKDSAEKKARTKKTGIRKSSAKKKRG